MNKRFEDPHEPLIVPTDEEWNKYSKKLQKFFLSKDKGMVLDADRVYANKNPKDESSGKAVFKILQNGLAAEKLVAIWEILKHKKEFIECTKMLSLKAKQIFDNYNFSVIVTCKPMAEELGNRIQGWLRQQIDIDVPICYLPTYNQERQDKIQPDFFKNKQVIILDDIVFSGGAIRRAIGIISSQGGKSVAILALVNACISEIIERNREKNVEFFKFKERKLPFYSLTDLPFNPLQDGQYNADKQIQIDYSDVKWDIYRIKLREFMLSKESGIVLNADKDYENKNPGKKSDGRAVFKLHSGLIVKEFVTIWELFDHGEVFRKCMEMLTIKAKEIYSKTHFSKIVTCTTTAKELATYVLGQLHILGDKEISTYHFGDYATQGFNPLFTNALENERVLILTDIVSSGLLIQNMGDVIIKQGGNPVAILAVAITRKEWIEEQKRTREPIKINFSRGSARLHNLTDLSIKLVNKTQYDSDKVIPIDFASVLPLKEGVDNTRYMPIYTIKDLLRFAEKYNAINFAFYDIDDKRFTIAFLIKRLLDKAGDAIWKGISNPIIKTASRDRSNPVILVSSFQQRDLIFKDFIEGRLRKAGYEASTVVTLKRGVKDNAYLKLTLGEKETKLANRDVILVLATLTTSEKMRSIISLLLTQRVRKVMVVCLLNRMGVYTTSFISAIERFTKRVSTGYTKQKSRKKFTDFEFHMVFSFLDIPMMELAKMHNQIEYELSVFKSRTKPDSFKRHANRLLTYFTTSNFIDVDERIKYKPLSYPYRLKLRDAKIKTISVKTQEGKIALITYNLALNHDYKPVFRELTNTCNSRTMIHLIGLILSDIEYLHFNGFLKKLMKRIVKRLRTLRSERFDFEQRKCNLLDFEGSRAYLELNIYAEMNMIFALGLIANHDPSCSLNKIMSFEELLFCGKKPNEWLEYENNLWHYFKEDRILFAISFLLHACHPEFYKGSSNWELKRKIFKLIEEFRDVFNNFANKKVSDKRNDYLKPFISMINGNLDLLLVDIGYHDRLDKHQVIQYLHREVLRPKKGHNQVITGLTQLLQSVRFFLESKKAEVKTMSYLMEDDTMQKVDHALSACATLPMITRYARQLFYFTPGSHDDQVRYTNPVGREGFATDVEDLITRLTNIGQRRKISRLDLSKIEKLERHFREDLTTSFLCKVLSDYVVDLGEIVYRSIEDANYHLSKKGLKKLLNTHIAIIKKRREKGKWIWPILCSNYLLLETLRNIFYNLRYTYQKKIDQKSINARSIEIDIYKNKIDIPPETAPLDVVVFKMIARGGITPTENDYTNLSNTIGDQFSKLREFGVIRNLNLNGNGRYFKLTLSFISCEGFPIRKSNNYMGKEYCNE